MLSPFIEIEKGSLHVKFYPLSIAELEVLEEEMKVLVGATRYDFIFTPERFKKMLVVYHASAKRGDPTITEDQVKSVVDMFNMRHINSAVLGTYGQDAPPTLTQDEAAPNGGAANPTSGLPIGGSFTPA
jgi:hypothetical protein